MTRPVTPFLPTMNRLVTRCFPHSVCLAILLGGLVGCKPAENTYVPPVTGEGVILNGVFVANGTDNYLKIYSTTPETGSISAVGYGQEITIDDNGIVNAPDGFLYDYQGSDSRFRKFSTSDEGVMTPVEQIPIRNAPGGSGMSSATWLDADRLYFTIGADEFRVVNVRSMKVEQAGKLAIPDLADHEKTVRFAIGRDDRIFVGYDFLDDTFSSVDTLYVAVYDRQFKLLKTLKDTRSSTAGLFGNTPVASVDEKGDIYFVSSPNDYFGRNPDKPVGVFRIRKGQDELDPSYFFNLDAAFGNNGNSFFYMGNGKALTQRLRADLLPPEGNYITDFAIDWYVIDVYAQSAVKLDVPLHAEPEHSCVKLNDGRTLFPANTREGVFAYLYDHRTGELKRGQRAEGLRQIWKIFKVR